MTSDLSRKNRVVLGGYPPICEGYSLSETRIVLITISVVNSMHRSIVCKCIYEM